MSNTKASKGRDLTQGALLPKIIVFALPLIATGVLQLLFNTADSVVVGRWGGDTKEECETALAAVGSCGSLINLIVNFFFGLSVGAGVCVAQDLGAKRYDDVQKVVHTSVLTALVSGTVVALIGMLFARSLLILMGTEPAVLDQAVPYMCAYFAGAPANMVYNYCASIMRSNGDTVHPLAFLTVAGVTNVGLNLIMVLVFNLGALGVGIATAASQWISCILIVWFMARDDGPCRLNFRKLRIDREKLRKIIYIGIPAGIQGMVFSFSNVLIQSSVNSFGKATVAANTAASNLCDYVYTAQNALYHAALTFVGQNVGAHRYDRIKSVALNCIGVVTAVGLVVGVLMVTFGEFLLGIYSPGNEHVIEIGMIRLRILATTYFLCGIMEVGSGVLRGLGKSLISMIVAIIGSCLMRVVWIYTVFAAFPTLDVLYLSYPVSWLLTAIAHFTFVFITVRNLRKAGEPSLQPAAAQAAAIRTVDVQAESVPESEPDSKEE